MMIDRMDFTTRMSPEEDLLELQLTGLLHSKSLSTIYEQRSDSQRLIVGNRVAFDCEVNILI